MKNISIESIELKDRSIESIREFMNDIIEYYNVMYGTDVELIDFEVSINGRLTRSLARYGFSITTYGTIIPRHIQFSKAILCQEDDVLINTIKHELAHYIVTYLEQENCNHDYRWQKVCKEIGMEDISSTTRIKGITRRYLVICKNDGIVAKRDRLTSSLKGYVTSGDCCCAICKNDKLMIYDTKNKCFVVGGTIEEEMKALSFIE